jgi:hypothetical protein
MDRLHPDRSSRRIRGRGAVLMLWLIGLGFLIVAVMITFQAMKDDF